MVSDSRPQLQNNQLPTEEDPPDSNKNQKDSSLNIKSRTPRRVKVYLLQGDDWLDNGTGYCMGQVDNASKKPYFIVRNELDSNDIILRLYVEGSIQYQRQQETLIVWTDLSGKDLALLFQENEGCADMCEFIIRVQQENLSPSISLYYVLTALQDTPTEGPKEITELITGPVSYPPDTPTPENLPETLEVVTQGSNSLYTRFKILSHITESGYLDKLFELLPQLERKRDFDSLFLLSDIVKVLLIYNEPAILISLLRSEKSTISFAGIMEYDRDLPKVKACHRDYLLDESNYRQVVEVSNAPICPGTDMGIFRRDFLLDYMKNAVLLRLIDDQALNALSSIIQSNQVEIINFLRDSLANDEFLTRLFKLYNSPDTDIKSKRDGVRLIHQHVLIAKGQMMTPKSEFYTALVQAGLLGLIKFSVRDTESTIRAMGTAILVAVIDQDVTIANPGLIENNDIVELEEDDEVPKQEFKSTSIKLSLADDMSLTLALSELLLNDKHPGSKIQAFEAIKTLMCSSMFFDESSPKPLPTAHDKEGGGDAKSALVKQYFKGFYENVAPMLFKGFADLISGDKETARLARTAIREDPTLYQHLCDLLSFFCHEHEPSILREFFTKSLVFDGILQVLTLDVTIVLKLAVMRCFKSLIYMNDAQLHDYVIRKKLFAPFFEFFETVAADNSLPNSLCVDLLESIAERCLKERSVWKLANHICSDYKLFLESKITEVNTGKHLLAQTAASADKMKGDAEPGRKSSKSEQNSPTTKDIQKTTKDIFDQFAKNGSGRKRESFNSDATHKRTCVAVENSANVLRDKAVGVDEGESIS